MIVIFLFMFIYITTLPYINATSATQAFFFQAYLRAISPAFNVCLENGMHFVCKDYIFFDIYNKIFWCLSCKKCLADAGSTIFVLFFDTPTNGLERDTLGRVYEAS